MTYKDAAAAAEAAKGGAGEEPSSEYESIDPSIFGRVKAKIRKSQVTIQSLKYLRKCVISDGKVMRTSHNVCYTSYFFGSDQFIKHSSFKRLNT